MLQASGVQVRHCILTLLVCASCATAGRPVPVAGRMALQGSFSPTSYDGREVGGRVAIWVQGESVVIDRSLGLSTVNVVDVRSCSTHERLKYSRVSFAPSGNEAPSELRPGEFAEDELDFRLFRLPAPEGPDCLEVWLGVWRWHSDAGPGGDGLIQFRVSRTP